MAEWTPPESNIVSFFTKFIQLSQLYNIKQHLVKQIGVWAEDLAFGGVGSCFNHELGSTNGIYILSIVTKTLIWHPPWMRPDENTTSGVVPPDQQLNLVTWTVVYWSSWTEEAEAPDAGAAEQGEGRGRRLARRSRAGRRRRAVQSSHAPRRRAAAAPPPSVLAVADLGATDGDGVGRSGDDGKLGGERRAPPGRAGVGPGCSAAPSQLALAAVGVGDVGHRDECGSEEGAGGGVDLDGGALRCARKAGRAVGDRGWGRPRRAKGSGTAACIHSLGIWQFG